MIVNVIKDLVCRGKVLCHVHVQVKVRSSHSNHISRAEGEKHNEGHVDLMGQGFPFHGNHNVVHFCHDGTFGTLSLM